MNALFCKAKAAPPFPIRSTHRTHVGRVRSVNEDRVLDASDRMLWVIADGMGGHKAGDVAAETLVAHLGATTAIDNAATLTQALIQANDLIRAQTDGQGGTTVVSLRIDNAVATLSWAGDSRAYLIRDGELRLLTHDHSVVQQLVDAGVITAEQALHHPHANVITNALGTSAEVRIDTAEVNLIAGDRILLCSDGLSRSLSERDVVGDCGLDPLADRMLTNALQRDGQDNISLILVEIAAS